MPEIKVVSLPKPDTEGTVPLESILQKRRSVRHYKDSSISIKLISQLLWAAQGITNQQGLRTAPSAGALYPLDIYIIAINVDELETGIYKYLTADHTLLLSAHGDYSQMLSKAALWQDAISQAPAVFVISGVEKKTTGKYGNRGVRYMYIEAGHAAQNLCLQAEALDLGSVTIGAFTDHEV
ncbi:MAG: nitroreductase, partial [Desulfobacterales bacterium SG8_35_2]